MRILALLVALTAGCGDQTARRAPDDTGAEAPGAAEGGEVSEGEAEPGGEGGAAGADPGGGDLGDGADAGGDPGGGPGGAQAGGPEGGADGGAPEDCTRAEHCDLGETCDLGVCIDRECDVDGDCPAEALCGDGLCRNLPRDCWAATNNPVFVGVTTEGDRDGGGSNLDASCAATGLVRESILRWDVDDSGRDYVLTIETDGFIPVVSLLSDCEGAVTEACTSFEAAAGRVLLPAVERGSYWIVVDGLNQEAPASRRFRLTVSETPGSDTPGGETCLQPELIEFDEAGRAQVSGDLIVASDEGRACGANQGGDWVYAFDVPDDSGLTVSVQSELGRVGWELRDSDCVRGEVLACLADPGSAPFGRVPAGRYHLIVDGPGDFIADLSLTAAPAAPANDSCASPQRIRLGVDGEAVVPGDTSIASDTRSPSCSELQGPDLTYRIELPAALRLRAQLLSAAGGTVSVREACGGDEADLHCVPAGEAVQVAPVAVDRTLHLVVEAGNAVGGPFDLVVQSLPPSTGDTCDDPALMQPAGEGLWRAEGSTIGQNDDYVEGCGVFGGETGADVFVAFDVPEAGTYHFGLQAGFDANLHVLAGQCGAEGSIACNDDAPEEGLESGVVARGLQPGPHFVVVDGHVAGEQGPFTLTAQLLRPPANNVCADAQPIALDPEDGVGRVAGSLRVAADQSTAGCAVEGWGEVWFTVDLPEASSLRAFTSPDGGLSQVAVAVYAGGCGQDELGCGLLRPDDAALYLPEVGPGTIPIVVEGADTATFELVVQAGPPAAPPANEACDTAEEVVFDEQGAATITGQLVRAQDDHEPACGGDGPDAAYFFDLNEPRQVRLVRTPALGDADIFVSAWNDACDGEPLACVAVTPAAGAGPSRLAGSLGPGRVRLIVEAGDGADLGYELALELDDPIEVPANDQCGGAIRVEFDVDDDDPDPVVIEGNTELAQNDYGAGCAAGALSPDVVYEIELIRAGALDVTMVAEGGWDNALHVRRGECHEAEAELLCNDDNPGIGSSRVTSRLAEPGTYFIIADGYNNENAGAFTLTVDVGPEPRCPDGEVVEIPDDADPEPIVIEGTTEGAQNSVEASCASNARSPDVMYTFELDRPRPLVAVMEADQGWDNALHLRGEPCVSEQAEVACNDDFEGIGTSRIEVEMLPPGTYFLFADGYAAGNEGAFTLEIDFGAAPEPPANDLCEAAEALQFDGPVARLSMDLAVAAADDPVCGEELVDAFWSYTPDDDGPYSFAATAGEGLLHVATDCAPEAPQCSRGAVLADALGERIVAVHAPEETEADVVALVGPAAEALQEGDTCDNAMGLPREGTVAIVGSMQGASDAVDHGDPVCPVGAGGPDRVFGMFLQAPAVIRADVVGADFEPHLWLRTEGCEDEEGGLAACGAARGGWSTLEAEVGDGLVTLVVDSLAEEAGGEFLLVVTTSPVEQ